MAPSSADDAASDDGSAYQFPEHARIARLLRNAKVGSLHDAHCWFGGDTAIVMANGEYRMSLDVDFLCSSREGYRALRLAVTARGTAGIFEESVKQLRDFRCDQYGLRVALEFEGQPIKFEITREGRIDVTGAINDDATSSLFPLNEVLCRDFENLHTLKPVRCVEVTTRRLDDILSESRVDFLKLDVQGAELLVLEGAERTLSETAVIHCEVEFSPIYKGKVLYDDVQRFLSDRGFYLVDLLIKHRYSYVAQLSGRFDDRLLWADAVFFQVSDHRGILIYQFMAAFLVYHKHSLAQHLLGRIELIDRTVSQA